MQRKIYKARPERLDFAMGDQKVSAEALGRAAGHADGSYIRRMRKGERRALKATQQTAEAICQMLHLPLDYLFEEAVETITASSPMPGSSKTVGVERRSA